MSLLLNLILEVPFTVVLHIFLYTKQSFGCFFSVVNQTIGPINSCVMSSLLILEVPFTVALHILMYTK